MVVPALVLAAGRGARLAPQRKLLLRVQGQPMLHRVLDVLLAAPRVRPIHVMLGHDAAAIEATCTPYAKRLRFVVHPQWAQGRTSTIHAGLRSLPTTADAVLIQPGDVPFISTALLDALLDAFAATGRITFPQVAGRKGHPVIFPRASWSRLEQLRGEETLHDYLLGHPDAAQPVAWDDEGCTLDIDTAQDWAALADR